MRWRPSDSEGPERAPDGHRTLPRRDFLVQLSLPVVTAACASDRTGLTRRFQRSAVGLFPADRYSIDLADVIARGFRELGVTLTGRRVLLKPNMVEYEAGTAINTHPHVVAGAAIACRRAGAADVVVAEGPGHRRDIEYLLTATGLYDSLRDAGVAFVDLNHDDVAWVPVRGGLTGLRELALPATLLRSDFIVSMPKLKVHHWAGLTCSMKNFFGVVPGAVYGWPKNLLHMRGIENSILDLNATIAPHFAIVDGVIAMDGDGPIMGYPRPLGFVAMGADLPAVDATCARIIGLAPRKLPYLRAADGLLGTIDERRILQAGEPIGRYASRFDLIERLEPLRSSMR